MSLSVSLFLDLARLREGRSVADGALFMSVRVRRAGDVALGAAALGGPFMSDPSSKGVAVPENPKPEKVALSLD
jgi:hypothetical protein